MKTEKPAIDFCKDRPSGKRIVVCCDGTGNKFIDWADPKNSNSNVVRFYSTLAITNEQVGYYHPGLGTLDDPRAKGTLESWWSRIKGLAFAAGFTDHVLDTYRYLMETYNDGDCVYLFGFSRGAYTVRALAGLLDGYGLLCRGNEGHLPYAWNEYIAQHDDREKTKAVSNTSFKETFSRRKFRIHFLGIWDTVSSVGWITTPLKLFNVAQNPTVRIGRHAVSIDERRCFYRDNLWEEATEAQLRDVASEDDPDPKQDLLAVWFPGVHSDVGGSYAQAESGLSNRALEWLIDEAEKAGATIKPHMKQLVLGEEVNPLPPLPDEQTRVRVLERAGLYKKPCEKIVHLSLRGIWWLLEVLPHQYYDKDDGVENWRTPLGMRRKIPGGTMKRPDGSTLVLPTYIHRSAQELMVSGVENKLYRPANITGGLDSLVPVTVEGQEDGSLFLYQPPEDKKPFRNEAWVRWSLMIAVSTVDVVIVGSVLAAGFFGLRGAVRGLGRM